MKRCIKRRSVERPFVSCYSFLVRGSLHKSWWDLKRERKKRKHAQAIVVSVVPLFFFYCLRFFKTTFSFRCLSGFFFYCCFKNKKSECSDLYSSFVFTVHACSASMSIVSLIFPPTVDSNIFTADNCSFLFFFLRI